MKINAIITDFDGTLVDTFLANLYAYKEAFNEAGYELTRKQYSDCYGLRFPEFMDFMNIPKDNEIRTLIKKKKAEVYLTKLDYINVNIWLRDFIYNQHEKGVKTAIASTASYNNLMAVVNSKNLNSLFDVIVTGEDVTFGKPNPEVYITTMSKLKVKPNETLIFEDSDVGLESARQSLANYIKV